MGVFRDPVSTMAGKSSILPNLRSGELYHASGMCIHYRYWRVVHESSFRQRDVSRAPRLAERVTPLHEIGLQEDRLGEGTSIFKACRQTRQCTMFLHSADQPILKLVSRLGFTTPEIEFWERPLRRSETKLVAKPLEARRLQHRG